MSNGLLFTNDALNVADAGVIAGYSRTLPVDASGAVCVAVNGTPTRTANGFAFDVDDRLVVADLADITHAANGVQFCADGALAVAPAGVVDHYANGFAFNADGRLVTT